MRQAMTSVAGGKILPAKTNWSIRGKSQFFRPKSTHSLRFTCHATCPLAQEYYSPRGGTVSTSHLPLNVPAATKSITLQEAKPSLRVTLMLQLHVQNANSIAKMHAKRK